VDNARDNRPTINTVRPMPDDHRSEDMYVDANGCLTEVVALGGEEVAVHYDAIRSPTLRRSAAYAARHLFARSLTSHRRPRNQSLVNASSVVNSPRSRQSRMIRVSCEVLALLSEVTIWRHWSSAT
jgi:hypothetical protein